MNEFDLRNFLYNNPLLEATKKGNEEEEKREEGAIADDRDHIDALDADAEADEKKLAKLKKDKKKDVPVKETNFHSPRTVKTTPIGDEDKELTTVDLDWYEKMEKERREKAGADMRKNQDPLKERREKETALRKAIQNEITSILKEAEEDVEVEDEENVDVDVERDVNVDVEKEVNIDDESEESKIEVDSELAGEDADTAAILGLLTKAQAEAEGLGDEKLMDQIGNTITYYTRAHVVKSTETRAVAENEAFTRRK